MVIGRDVVVTEFGWGRHEHHLGFLIAVQGGRRTRV